MLMETMENCSNEFTPMTSPVSTELLPLSTPLTPTTPKTPTHPLVPALTPPSDLDKPGGAIIKDEEGDDVDWGSRFWFGDL